MKELHYYVCEICKREYDDKQTALDCEHSHIKPGAIVGYYYDEFDSYPNDIRIEMHDGRVLSYIKK